ATMCATTLPPRVWVSSNFRDSICGLSAGRCVEVTGWLVDLSRRGLPWRHVIAIRMMKAKKATGSATRRTRIERCTRIATRYLSVLFRASRSRAGVDDLQPRARGRVRVGLDVEEHVGARAGRELRGDRLRGGPHHRGGAAARVFDHELGAIRRERARGEHQRVAAQEQRLRIARAERLEHLVRGEELGVDGGERKGGVNLCFAAEQMRVECRELR